MCEVYGLSRVYVQPVGAKSQSAADPPPSVAEKRKASELVDGDAIPVQRAVPVRRSPGPDRLVGIADGEHVVGRERRRSCAG